MTINNQRQILTTSHLRTLVGATAAALLLLAGCSGTSDGNGGDGALPEASGDFGDAPEFTWPDSDPSGELEVEVLSEGDGPEVTAGSIVVANYEGHVWGNDEPFDSSYERGEPARFPLDGVVQGWGEGIPGHSAGSRLLISIPPEKGYGSEGNAQAGIGGEDTIVFVVDVVSSFEIDSLGDADAKPVDLPDDVPVTVDGNPGEEVSVSVDADAEEPDESETFPLSRGSGEKVADGDNVVVSYTLTTWDNELTESSSMAELGPNAGPQMLPVGAGSTFDLVEGYEVGSRVLIIQTAVQDMPAMVVVADILETL